MHVVVWKSAGQQFATSTRQVVEVIPFVQPRPVAHQPAWMRGLINYRQQLTPLLDASLLLGFAVGEPRLADRILIVRVARNQQQPDGLVALRVDSVVDLQNISFPDATTHAARAPEFDFLGPVAIAGSSTIQLVDVNGLPIGAIPFADASCLHAP